MHLSKDGFTFEAIAFNMSDCFEKLSEGVHVDIVYSVEENIWKGKSTIQLKIKDLKIL
jgi:single-stranded-DNA-specific exonuclease